MAHTAKLDSKPNNSLWADSSENFSAQSALESFYDVVIIGGGFSGLWSAFHLITTDPSLRIAIFEAKTFGFGASGRNGGWVSSDYPVSRNTLEKRHGPEASDALFDSLITAIDEIGSFASAYAPQAHFIKSGTLMFARSKAQETRLKEMVDDIHIWRTKSELDSLIRVEGSRGGLFNEHCATINPVGLLNGLISFLHNHQVQLFENSWATSTPNGVLVNSNLVKANIVLHATEVYGEANRTFIPLYSQMVATEVIPEHIWKEIGVERRFTFAEGTHLINYAQRTADNRLAVGGRGATYPFGSRLISGKEMTATVHENLRKLAQKWFPQLQGIQFTHSWGGAVAITRDWEPYVQFDSQSGQGRIGGYAGDGVTMSYLASKIIAALITNQETALTNLHFVNRKVRNWEFEPLRYLAVNSLVKLSGVADKEEEITGRPSVVSKLIAPLILR